MKSQRGAQELLDIRTSGHYVSTTVNRCHRGTEAISNDVTFTRTKVLCRGDESFFLQYKSGQKIGNKKFTAGEAQTTPEGSTTNCDAANWF